MTVIFLLVQTAGRTDRQTERHTTTLTQAQRTTKQHMADAVI